MSCLDGIVRAECSSVGLIGVNGANMALSKMA